MELDSSMKSQAMPVKPPVNVLSTPRGTGRSRKDQIKVLSQRFASGSPARRKNQQKAQPAPAPSQELKERAAACFIKTNVVKTYVGFNAAEVELPSPPKAYSIQPTVPSPVHDEDKLITAYEDDDEQPIQTYYQSDIQSKHVFPQDAIYNQYQKQKSLNNSNLSESPVRSLYGGDIITTPPHSKNIIVSDYSIISGVNSSIVAASTPPRGSPKSLSELPSSDPMLFGDSEYAKPRESIPVAHSPVRSPQTPPRGVVQFTPPRKSPPKTDSTPISSINDSITAEKLHGATERQQALMRGLLVGYIVRSKWNGQGKKLRDQIRDLNFEISRSIDNNDPEAMPPQMLHNQRKIFIDQLHTFMVNYSVRETGRRKSKGKPAVNKKVVSQKRRNLPEFARGKAAVEASAHKRAAESIPQAELSPRKSPSKYDWEDVPVGNGGGGGGGSVSLSMNFAPATPTRRSLKPAPTPSPQPQAQAQVSQASEPPASTTPRNFLKRGSRNARTVLPSKTRTSTPSHAKRTSEARDSWPSQQHQPQQERDSYEQQQQQQQQQQHQQQQEQRDHQEREKAAYEQQRQQQQQQRQLEQREREQEKRQQQLREQAEVQKKQRNEVSMQKKKQRTELAARCVK